MRKIFSAFLLISFVAVASAQQKEQAVWLSTSGTYKVSKHWSLYWDNQFRSSDHIKYFRQFITRPGIVYNFNAHQFATIGYSYAKTNRLNDGIPGNDIKENRVWEQFVYLHRVAKFYATQRIRLEQRNVETAGKADVFSQRFRFYTRYMLPLIKKDTFNRGGYVAVQNEVYLNVQNKNKLNGSILDQNRVYFALGYRLSPKLDLELGVINQFIKGASINTSNNVGQLGLVTRL
ncbi:MAG: hypothetical protein JWN56_789 [Sphingobacteriales bacterium]|nr:hypothetical protein [Sphingobacteriales bacterium]